MLILLYKMNRDISVNEIHYLLDHLNTCYSGISLLQYMETGPETAGKLIADDPKILFPLTNTSFEAGKVILIDGVPVLFPCSEHERWFSTEGRHIRFHHDILKSAFYLLSGYQEYISEDSDQYGRFPWKSSIQCRLGISQKPVVNYYFEVILEAIEAFCKINGLAFQRTPAGPPSLFLSHDVDRIRKYSLRNMVYTSLQLPGFISSDLSLNKRWKNFRDYSRGTLLFKKDPYRNFDELIALEDSMKINSTWFFLEKTKMDNSRYHFNDPFIRELIGRLEEKGHEIGVHGTLESSIDPEAMSGALNRLNAITGKKVAGNRQHFLKYNNPVTTKILDRSGLLYDATLGFAEHIGFRNSFASPFRLYDFENDRPADLWELPLNVMDVTLLNYMIIPNEKILSSVRPTMEETAKFGGVFSLLWHNCNLDEEEYPGVNVVYRALLDTLLHAGFLSKTGRQIIHEHLQRTKTSGASKNNW